MKVYVVLKGDSIGYYEIDSVYADESSAKQLVKKMARTILDWDYYECEVRGMP
jgi:hypothetical protein